MDNAAMPTRCWTRCRRYLSHTFVGVMTLAPAVPVLAQTGGEQRFAIEEVVVSARKRDETLQDVPDSVSVFTATMLEDLGVTDLGDLNQSLPNFNLRQSQQPGTAFIALRGVAMQRFQEPSVAIVVDGVQLTSPYQILQSLHDIQQIEVLRGPQGSLYGRNAIGGAINITTRQAENEVEGLIRAGYAEGDTWNVEGRVSGPVTEDRVFYSLLGVYRDKGGLIDNVVTGDKADFEEMAFVRGSLRFVLSPDATINLRGSHEYRDGGVGYFNNIPSGDVNDTSQPVSTGSEGVGTRKLTDISAQLAWETGLGELSATTAYSKVSDRFFQDIDFEAIAAIDADQLVDVESVSQEIRLTSSSDTALRWLVGGYFADIDQEVSTFLLINTCYLIDPFSCPQGPVPRDSAIVSPFGVNDNNNRTFAFFGQLNYDLREDLELTLGVRYDRDRRSQFSITEDLARRETFDSVQPKVSLAYRWKEDVMTYVTASKGFRSGAFNGTDYVTRMYDAESLWNFETGAKTDLFERRLRLNIAAFYMDYKDRQEYVLQPGTGAQALFNIPESRIVGFEAEAVARLNDSLDINLGLGVLDAEVRRGSRTITDSFGTDFVGNRLPNVPTLTANAGLHYSINLGPDLTFTGRADWALKRGLRWSLGNLGDRQDDVHLVSIRGSLHLHNLQVTAYAENLLDEDYYAEIAMPGFGSINPTPGGFRAEPRQMGVEVTFSF
ncbi:MAG: TonB-dependent receptor [Haliea sp.]